MQQDPNQQPPQQQRPPMGSGQTPPPPPPPGYMPMYPPPQKSGGAGGMGIIRRVFTGLMAAFLTFSVILNIYFGAYFASSVTGPIESTYAGSSTATNRIVILPIEGAIDSEMAHFIGKALRSLKKNPPQALLLRINSPGGGVSPSDQIWNGLMQFKSDTNVPIISSFGSVAASGGYYIASASDYIVSEPTCITGSIGVIAQAFTLDRMMDKVGVTPETIVSTDSTQKDTLNTFRPWTDDDRSELRVILDSAYERFIKIVDDARPDLDLEQVRKLATGAPYTTNQAIENKLVDAQGYLADAITKAVSMAGLPAGSQPKVTVIQQNNPFGFLGSVHQNDSTNITSLFNSEKMRSLAGDLAVPQLEYRLVIK